MTISKSGLIGVPPSTISTLIDRINSEISGITAGTPADSSVTNAKVAADAAIAFSKLATLSSGNILVGSAGNVATSVAVTGDISITNAGLTAIASGVIVNDDINSSAAIAWSKMASSTDITSAGKVASLTLGSDAQGDVYYRGASALARLAAGSAGQALISGGVGSNPYWGEPNVALASKLTQTYQIEAGTNDVTHSVTSQTVGGVTLTIPDFASVADTYAFITLAQTFANKTLTTPVIASIYQDAGKTKLMTLPNTASDTLCAIAASQTLSNKTLTAPKIVTTGYIADDNGDEYLMFVKSTTPVTYVKVTSGDTTVAPKVQGAGETNTDLHLLGTGTGNVKISDGTDPTKLVVFEIAGATTAKTMTLTCSHTDDRALTLPDATDTLVGKATADTFTNKSFNCDGTGNVLTNVNADELDPVALGSTAVYGVPFSIIKTVSNLSDAGQNLIQNSTFKFLITGAKFINTSAPGGTCSWQICQGAVGSIGTAITEAVSVANTDKLVTRSSSIDDDTYTVASGASGDLVLVGDASGTLDGVIVIDCIRID